MPDRSQLLSLFDDAFPMLATKSPVSSMRQDLSPLPDGSESYDSAGTRTLCSLPVHLPCTPHIALLATMLLIGEGVCNLVQLCNLMNHWRNNALLF